MYVGSGKNNVDKRIERPLRKNKKLFWHIDYFAKEGEIEEIYVGRKKECSVANLLLKYSDACVAGFGSSDCECCSHLFYMKDIDKVKSQVKQIGFKKYL